MLARACPGLKLDRTAAAFRVGATRCILFRVSASSNVPGRSRTLHAACAVALSAILTGTPQAARADGCTVLLCLAGNSPEHDALKKLFPFGDPPYAVALGHGRQKAAWSRFDEAEPEASLRQLGFIE